MRHHADAGAGPSRREAVSYSRPASTSPGPESERAIRTTQTLSNVAKLANASGSSESRSKLVSGLDGPRNRHDPRRSDEPPDQDLPVTDQVGSASARSIRADGSIRRSAARSDTAADSIGSAAGGSRCRSPAAVRHARRRVPRRVSSRAEPSHSATRHAGPSLQGASQGSLAIHGVISHVSIP